MFVICGGGKREHLLKSRGNSSLYYNEIERSEEKGSPTTLASNSLFYRIKQFVVKKDSYFYSCMNPNIQISAWTVADMEMDNGMDNWI